MFNFLFKEKSYDKYGNILKKILTTKDQRLEAIDFLKKLPAEKSVPQLLKRFEIAVDSGFQDTREKEQCLNIIVSYGEKSKSFVRNYIDKERKISWPLKIAEKIFSHDEYLDIIVKNLNPNMEVFDEATLERNEEILLALKEVKLIDEQMIIKISSFLQSRDENVRMAALECLEEQSKHSQLAKETIMDLLNQVADDSNSRFLGVVKSVVNNHKWKEN